MTEPDYDLTKCAICGQDATFTDASPGANPVSYCTNDLPAHLATVAAAGQMPLATDDTKAELLEQAAELEIEGRSGMTKAQLQTAVAAAKLSAANIAPPEPTLTGGTEPLAEADIPQRPEAEEPGPMGDATPPVIVDEEPAAPTKATRGSRKR